MKRLTGLLGLTLALFLLSACGHAGAAPSPDSSSPYNTNSDSSMICWRSRRKSRSVGSRGRARSTL